MSDLRPRGVPVIVCGVERHFLFTLAAIDEAQHKFEKKLNEILADIADEFPAGHTLKDIMQILIQDEIDREKNRNPDSNLQMPTEQELEWEIAADTYIMLMKAVYEAYGISLPEPEDKDPNRKSGQQSN